MNYLPRKKQSALALLIIYGYTNDQWMYIQLTREIGSQYSKYIHRKDTYSSCVVDKRNIDFINPQWIIISAREIKIDQVLSTVPDT